jgi:hypothetical protein
MVLLHLRATYPDLKVGENEKNLQEALKLVGHWRVYSFAVEVLDGPLAFFRYFSYHDR